MGLLLAVLIFGHTLYQLPLEAYGVYRGSCEGYRAIHTVRVQLGTDGAWIWFDDELAVRDPQPEWRDRAIYIKFNDLYVFVMQPYIFAYYEGGGNASRGSETITGQWLMGLYRNTTDRPATYGSPSWLLNCAGYRGSPLIALGPER